MLLSADGVSTDHMFMFGAQVQFKSTISINRKQILAARAWLEMSQQELADLSGVSKRTISHLEAGGRIPHDRTLRDIQTALEARGAEFLFDNGRGTGIKMSDHDATGTEMPG